MDLRDSAVLILGGAGLVGRAVSRRVLAQAPGRLVIGSLRRNEAEGAVRDLLSESGADVRVESVWGDLFVPAAMKDRPLADLLADGEARRLLMDDLFGPLKDEVVDRSALGALLLEVRPDVVVDCINTAGALAYRDLFSSVAEVRTGAEAGPPDREAVERHLSSLYLPNLIRHVQIAFQAMRRVGTRVYVKIGTSGTGGMGLNIPFTHSEERPSRMLLAKAGLAGAQTLLLYLMARTPGAPAVKEIKPTAAISWKAIGFGPVHKEGRPIKRADATRPMALDEAFSPEAACGFVELGEPLDGVYLDAGENGFFSMPEFETLSSLGMMEFITPEEIAVNVVREITAHPTGKDVVAALDAATMGPTYRAGVLRSAALERMEEIEQETGVRAVAYEMLGPPRLSKLLFEGELLRRLYGQVDIASGLIPEEAADRARALLDEDADLRQRIVSIGLPILTPDGSSLLRGPDVKVSPDPGEDTADVAERGWVDLRAENWVHWAERIQGYRAEIESRPGVEAGSIGNHDYGEGTGEIRPGALAAWILRAEERGQRIKR